MLVVVAARLKAHEVFVVQAALGFAARHDHVALIQLQAGRTRDGFSHMVKVHLQGFALGSKPETVVDQFGVLGAKGVALVQHFAVKGQALDSAAGVIQQRSPRSFVHAARFHAHKAVFYKVNAANTVSSTDFVGPFQKGSRTQFFAVNSDGVAVDKFNFDIFGLVGGLFGADRQLKHVSGRLGPRVFKDTALIGDMQHVGVGAPRVFFGGRHRNAMGAGVLLKVGAALKVPVAPRGHGNNVGLQCISGHLKAHLVVAFARRAVRHRHRAFFLGNFDHLFGDEGAGNAGS